MGGEGIVAYRRAGPSVTTRKFPDIDRAGSFCLWISGWSPPIGLREPGFEFFIMSPDAARLMRLHVTAVRRSSKYTHCPESEGQSPRSAMEETSRYLFYRKRFWFSPKGSPLPSQLWHEKILMSMDVLITEGHRYSQNPTCVIKTTIRLVHWLCSCLGWPVSHSSAQIQEEELCPGGTFATLGILWFTFI